MDRYRLRYAIGQDAKQLGPLAASVMYDDFHRWLEPVSEFPIDAQIRLRVRDFSRRIRLADLDNLHLVAVSVEDVQKVVGYCHFCVRNGPSKELSSLEAWVRWAYARYDQLVDATIYRRDIAFRNMRRYRAIGAAIGPQMKKYLNSPDGEKRPYVYVNITCVASEYQGCGIGGDLVRSVIRFAKERRLEIFLEATPEGARLYKRHGFRELCSCDIVDAGKVACTVPLMLWNYEASDQVSSPSTSASS